MCKILTKKIICACTRELVWLKDWRLHKSANVVSGELPLGKAESEGTQKNDIRKWYLYFLLLFLQKVVEYLHISKNCATFAPAKVSILKSER